MAEGETKRPRSDAFVVRLPAELKPEVEAAGKGLSEAISKAAHVPFELSPAQTVTALVKAGIEAQAKAKA